MPKEALGRDQKKRYKIKALIEWISGRMHSIGMTQEDLGAMLGISQGAVSSRLNPKTYEKNKKSDPFSFVELLVLFEVLKATPEEKEKLMTL